MLLTTTCMITVATLVVLVRLSETSKSEILDKVVSDSKEGNMLVEKIAHEEKVEEWLRKIRKKDDDYIKRVRELHADHKYTKKSSLRLRMFGVRHPVRMSQAEQDSTLDFHNKLRMEEALSQNISDMRFLKWDTQLAEMAQALADTCVFEHYNIRRANRILVGQNLGYVVASELTPLQNFKGIIQAFFDERKWMDSQTFQCKGKHTCGHYRQLIYSGVTKLGCAYSACKSVWHVYMKNGNPEFIYNPYVPGKPIFYGVCNYAQYAAITVKLFHYGPPCTFCSLDKNKPYRCVDSSRITSSKAALCDQCKTMTTGCEMMDPKCSKLVKHHASRFICRIAWVRPSLCKTKTIVRTVCSDQCHQRWCRWKKQCDLGLEDIYPYNIDTSNCKNNNRPNK